MDSSKLSYQHSVERFFDVDALPRLDEMDEAAVVDGLERTPWSARDNIPEGISFKIILPVLPVWRSAQLATPNFDHQAV
ncbi:MAG: hypothetical protein CBE00_01760 [Planctomycetaceae bacterium TMED240]|nr:MAG: hypothetical protein CBE00_01760 [Planctomycetaceae bacterium TMED240]